MKSIAHFMVWMVLFSSTLTAAPRTPEHTFSTPGEAAMGSGHYIHGAKPGVLLIRTHLLGAVGTQGIHYFPEGTNVLDAMLYAGGMGETTKLNGIKIRRKGHDEIVEVDLEELIDEGGNYPVLQDGDVVQVPWNWRRDISTIGVVTGFITSMTAFTVAIVALGR